MKESNHTKKPRALTKDIPEEIKDKIIHDFCHSKENTTTGLANKYQMSYYLVNSIINAHLKSLNK